MTYFYETGTLHDRTFIWHARSYVRGGSVRSTHRHVGWTRIDVAVLNGAEEGEGD